MVGDGGLCFLDVSGVSAGGQVVKVVHGAWLSPLDAFA